MKFVAVQIDPRFSEDGWYFVELKLDGVWDVCTYFVVQDGYLYGADGAQGEFVYKPGELTEKLRLVELDGTAEEIRTLLTYPGCKIRKLTNQ